MSSTGRKLQPPATWMTYLPSLVVHAIYPDEDLRDFDFGRQEWFPVCMAVCGWRFEPGALDEDQGGTACGRCIKVALGRGLSLPSRFDS